MARVVILFLLIPLTASGVSVEQLIPISIALELKLSDTQILLSSTIESLESVTSLLESSQKNEMLLEDSLLRMQLLHDQLSLQLERERSLVTTQLENYLRLKDSQANLQQDFSNYKGKAMSEIRRLQGTAIALGVIAVGLILWRVAEWLRELL